MRRRRRGPAFVQLHHWLLDSSAWRDLEPSARALYVELKRRYNGFNNGTIGLGVREAAECLCIHRNTANRAFKSLEEHGFIARAKSYTFNQKRRATEWLLTEEADSRTGHTATKDFMRWRPAEKQNIVPLQGRIVPLEGHKAERERQKSPDSPCGGTVKADFGKSQSLQGDTSRYSHIPIAAQPAEEARPYEARAHRSGQAVGSAPIVTDSLRSTLKRGKSRAS